MHDSFVVVLLLVLQVVLLPKVTSLIGVFVARQYIKEVLHKLVIRYSLHPLVRSSQQTLLKLKFCFVRVVPFKIMVLMDSISLTMVQLDLETVPSDTSLEFLTHLIGTPILQTLRFWHKRDRFSLLSRVRHLLQTCIPIQRI